MSTTTPQARKEAGQYLFPQEEIPSELTMAIKAKIGVEKPMILPAKEHGSYFGSVLLNGNNYLAQVVGKEGKTVIVHRKGDLDLVAQRLQWMNEKMRMNGQPIQVHYNEGRATVYPWNNHDKTAPETGKALNGKEPEKAQPKPLTADQFVEAATAYAHAEIKNGPARNAFLHHISIVSQAMNEKAVSAPEKAAKDKSDSPQKDAPEKKAAAPRKARAASKEAATADLER